MAILDKALSRYDFQGRAWLYLEKQCLAVIYKTGPGYT